MLLLVGLVVTVSLNSKLGPGKESTQAGAELEESAVNTRPDVEVYKTDIALKSSRGCGGRTCKLSVTVSYPVPAPSSGLSLSRSPSPVVLLVSGFLQPTTYYSFYARALAQAGFAVIQYAAQSRPLPDEVELGLIYELLQWAGVVSKEAGHPLHGRLDLNRLYAAGHSRGGKLVALLLSGWRPAGLASPASPGSFGLQRVLLLDPVDSGGRAGGREGPSSIEKLRGLNKSAGELMSLVVPHHVPTHTSHSHLCVVAPGRSPGQQMPPCAALSIHLCIFINLLAAE